MADGLEKVCEPLGKMVNLCNDKYSDWTRAIMKGSLISNACLCFEKFESAFTVSFQN